MQNWLRRGVGVVLGLSLAATGLVQGATDAHAAYDEHKGPNPTNRVTLTFDDCPKSLGQFKATVLAAEQMDIALVLFPHGQCISNGMFDAAFARAHGHYVFNHSVSHPDLTTLSYAGVQRQLGTPGVVTSYGRPPYGAINSTVRSAYASVGMKPWLWNVDTNDWRGKSASELISYVNSTAQPGDSVLMHMQWNGFNATVLSGIKAGLAKRGIGICRNFPGTTPSKPAQLDCNASGGTPTPGNWSGDLTGDGRADLLPVDSEGRLWRYNATNSLAFTASTIIGPGWQGTRWAGRVPDLTGDQVPDLLAVGTDGALRLYRSNGRKGFGSAINVGRGWQGMSKMAVLPDVDRDGAPELLAADSNGTLKRYRVTLKGVSHRADVGKGWRSNITRTLSLGNTSGDSTADLLAVTSKGDLISYSLNNSGRIVSAHKVGRGWASMTAVTSPGDVDKDGRRDLIGRRSDGTLWLYRHLGGGQFSAGKQVGRGWGGMRLFI